MESLGISEKVYYQLLASDFTQSGMEWAELVLLVTTGETYFFRDKIQIELLQKQILPELIDTNCRRRTLKIWSAGCATGEEAYSLAILVDGILPDRAGWEISILGTDINKHYLERAAKGTYGNWSFRNFKPDERYFHKLGENWQIDERIRSMLTFRPCNLIQDDFPDAETRDVDLILCRNVFIYFDAATIAAVARKFAHTLNSGGYLMTAPGEVPNQKIPGLTPKIFPGLVIYRRTGEEEKLSFAEIVSPTADHKRQFEQIEDQQQKIRRQQQILQEKIRELYEWQKNRECCPDHAILPAVQEEKIPAGQFPNLAKAEQSVKNLTHFIQNIVKGPGD